MAAPRSGRGAAARRPPRPARAALLPAVLAALAAALVLARTAAHGAALDWDAVNYLSVADSLLAGEGFTQVYRGEAYMRWPPLWPLLLAASALPASDPAAVAGPINAAAFGLTVFVGGRWLLRRIRARVLAVQACLALALAAPLAGIASRALTEPLFVLFATLALTQAERRLRGGGRLALLWAAAWTALACLTRYSGLVLIAALVPLLLVRPGAPLRDKARDAAAYALVAAAPLCLWMLRNVLIGGEPLGRREPPRHGLPEIAEAFLRGLGEWALPLPAGLPAAAAAAPAALALAALAVWTALALVRSRRDAAAWRERTPLFVFGGFALIYLAALAATAANTYVAPPGGRHLLPAFVPLLFAAAFALDRFLRREEGRAGGPPPGPFARAGIAGTRPAAAVALALALWLCWSVALQARGIARAHEGADRGFAAPRWERSELLRRVRETPIAGRVLTGLTPALYLHNGAEAEYVFLPYAFNRAVGKIGQLADGDHLVWFHASAAGRNFGAPDLRGLPGLEPLAELDDGAIFRVRRPFANDAHLEAYAALAALAPVARAPFDVYLEGRTLTWLRESCAPEDAAAPFFLHVVPLDADDLPAERRRDGFDSLGFDFERHGVRFGGRCLVQRGLPEYGIGRVRTGQRRPGERRPLWEAELPFGG